MTRGGPVPRSRAIAEGRPLGRNPAAVASVLRSIGMGSDDAIEVSTVDIPTTASVALIRPDDRIALIIPRRFTDDEAAAWARAIRDRWGDGIADRTILLSGDVDIRILRDEPTSTAFEFADEHPDGSGRWYVDVDGPGTYRITRVDL